MKYLAFLGADIWVWMWPLVKCLRCKSFKLQSQATPAAMNTVLWLKQSVLPLPFRNRAKLQQTKVSLRILFFSELVLVFQKLTCNRQPYPPKWQDSDQCNCLVWAVSTLMSKNHGSFAGFLLGVGGCEAGLYCLTSLLLFSFLWQPPAYFQTPQLEWGPLSTLTFDPYFPATSTFVWWQYPPLSSLSSVLFPSFFLPSPLHILCFLVTFLSAWFFHLIFSIYRWVWETKGG